MDPRFRPTVEVEFHREVFSDEDFQDDDGKTCPALITYYYYYDKLFRETRIVEYNYLVLNDPHMTEDSMEESIHDAVRFHAGFTHVYFECKKGNAITNK